MEENPNQPILTKEITEGLRLNNLKKLEDQIQPKKRFRLKLKRVVTNKGWR